MTLWGRLTSWIRPRADFLSDVRHPTAWLTNWALGGVTRAGIRVSPQSAMGLSTYYACIRNISEDVGKLPLLTYRRLLPRGKERVPGHWAYPLLHDAPNDDMTAMTFREVLTAHALGWGNGYAEIVRNGRGIPGAFAPIHPSRVHLQRDDQGRLVYDVYGNDGIYSAAGINASTIRLPQDDVLHIKGLGSDGYTGYSIVQLAAESLGLSLAAQTFGASFFGGGAALGGILSHPKTLSPEGQVHLRESWQTAYGGPWNAGKTAILEEGMTYTRIGIPPEEAQFLQTRIFQVPEVCRWFRMPPHKAQHLDNAHYNNVEQQNLEYVVDTLMPWLVRWESELRRKLFADEPEVFAEHLILGLLRGDQAARAAYYKARFEMGTLSPDDIREIENENPLPAGEGGNLYYLAANNFQPLRLVAQQVQPGASMQPFVPTLPGRNGTNGHANGHAVVVEED